MSSANIDLSYQLTDGFAARFIRYKVARLISRASIRRVDRDDLEQELKLHLLRRFDKFDPAVAHWNSFVVAVVERQLLTILADRRRRRLQFTSLADITKNTDRSENVLQEPIRSSFDPTEQLDVILDVHDMLTRLPEHTQRLCEHLMQDCPSEVARQMQVPRTTLHGHISMLRNMFGNNFEFF